MNTKYYIEYTNIVMKGSIDMHIIYLINICVLTSMV